MLSGFCLQALLFSQYRNLTMDNILQRWDGTANFCHKIWVFVEFLLSQYECSNLWLYILWLAMYSSFWLRRLPRKASLSVSSAPAAGAGSAHGRLVDVYSWPLLCLKLVRLQNFRQIWVYCYIFPGFSWTYMEPQNSFPIQFLGSTQFWWQARYAWFGHGRLLGGLQEIPWITGYGPANSPPKNAKIESVAIGFHNEHRFFFPLLGTNISPTKGCASSPESISEESKSPCAAHGSLHQAREGLWELRVGNIKWV